MNLTNLSLASIEWFSAFVIMIVLILLVNYVVNKYTKHKIKCDWKLIFLIGGLLLTYKVVTSPITRPVNDVHDKGQEIRILKNEGKGEILLPDLKDSTPKREYEDLSATPLLDEVLKQEN